MNVFLFKKVTKKPIAKNKKQQRFYISPFLLPMVLAFLFAVLLFTDATIKRYAMDYMLRPYNNEPNTVAFYPVLKEKINPDISAQAGIVMDDESKTILYVKNPTLRFSMASTTKIMTALTALEHYKINDVLTVKTATVEGAVVGLEEGERLTFESLLYGMLLPSGNDAALAIAQNYPNGEKAFIEKMNQKAKALHLVNTHFEDSAGLLDRADYTTVIDLARLGSSAMRNVIFAEIVGSKYKIIETVDGNKVYALTNLNKLLNETGVSGIKTGFTDEALGVLVTSKKIGNHTIIIVVMKSQDRFLDTQVLLREVEKNINYLPMHP